MYFITSVSPDNTRCVGYVSNLDEAICIVENDKYDLYEAGGYPHIVIEKIPEGIYQYDMEPMWYEYNEKINGYVELAEKPSYIWNNMVGFAIG